MLMARKGLFQQIRKAVPRTRKKFLQGLRFPCLHEVRRVFAVRELHNLDNQVLPFKYLDGA
jgi:hypothetical protein